MIRMVFSLLFLGLIFTAEAGLDDYTLNPVREYEVHPADYGMDFEEIFFKTEDDVKLRGWLFPSPNKTREMMVMISDGRGNMADDLEIAGRFISQNYQVLMFDFRGYGESDDFRISTKFFIYNQFHQDVDAALDYCKKQHATYNVNIYGRGIGANLALGCGATNIRIKKVIADGPVLSMEYVKNFVMEKTGEKILMPLSYNSVKLEPKFTFKNNGDHLRSILFIFGRQDEFANALSMSEAIADVKKISSVWMAPNATNANQNFDMHNDDWTTKVKEFLEGGSFDDRTRDEK